MRYLILFVLFLIPLSGISAHTATPPPPDNTRLTEDMTAFGVTVYYPNTMSADFGSEIFLYFEDGSDDIITITPPEALDDYWSIPQSDLHTMSNAFYDQLRENLPRATVRTDGVVSVIIGDYPAGFFILGEDNIYTLIAYMFETPIGIFSATLETSETDPLPKTEVLYAIIKAMNLYPDVPSLSASLLPRLAPTPDVRMGERVTSLDEQITYQMPFGWVRDSASTQADLIGDSQATLDSLNNGFVVPPDGMAVGMVAFDMLDDLGLSATTPYAVLEELQTVLMSNTQPYHPMWRYTNLPYAAYVQQLGTNIFEHGYVIAMYIPNSDEMMILFVFTQDFDRDEQRLIAIMNSVQINVQTRP